jgi:hypothetical protein
LFEILSTPLEFTGGNIKNAFGQLNFDLKRKPDHHAKVREYLRANPNTFLDAVNEVIRKAVEGFRQSDGQCKGMLVIVDNLDRILAETVPGTSRNNHDELFITTRDQLTSLDCHVIYTIPWEFYHSTSGTKLALLYSNFVHKLPMIPVRQRETAEEHTEGMQTLAEMVRRRLRVVADATAFDTAFDGDDITDEVVQQRLDAVADTYFDSPDTIRRLCAVSGGYVRQLMTLINSASFNCPSLPITREAVEDAIVDLRDNTFDGLRLMRETLRKVAQTNSIDEIRGTAECQKLLDCLAIMEYRDKEGGYWHDINPIIRESKDFAACK